MTRSAILRLVVLVALLTPALLAAGDPAGIDGSGLHAEGARTVTFYVA